MRILLLFSILMLLSAAGLSGMWWYTHRSRPSTVQPGEPQQQEPMVSALDPGPPPVLFRLKPFELIDQHNQPFSSESLAGQVWVADFIFTRCAGPCPRMTAAMGRLQNRLEQLQLVTVSADPTFDTPEILAAYATQNHATDRWHFLTGKWSSIHTLAQKGFKVTVLAPPEDNKTLITHGTRLILVDRQGRVRGYYHSDNELALRQLELHARALLDGK